MYVTSVIEIQKVIEDYFYGIYDGDVQKMQKIFHSSAMLYGDVNGKAYLKNKEEYLEDVKNRKCPRELEEVFNMKTISIEVIGNNAVARLSVPMLGYNYTDILSFSKIEGSWKIVNKLYTNNDFSAISHQSVAAND